MINWELLTQLQSHRVPVSPGTSYSGPQIPVAWNPQLAPEPSQIVGEHQPIAPDLRESADRRGTWTTTGGPRSSSKDTSSTSPYSGNRPSGRSWRKTTSVQRP